MVSTMISSMIDDCLFNKKKLKKKISILKCLPTSFNLFHIDKQI